MNHSPARFHSAPRRSHSLGTSRSLVAAAVVALSIPLVLLFAPAPAHAQVDFGVRGGVYSDDGDPFVGAELLGNFHGTRWYYNPNVEVVFVDPGDLVTVNADFHYDVPTTTPFDVWLGAGGALVFRDYGNDGRRGRADDSTTDPGLNLLGGLGFNPNGDVRPYVQGKLLLSDDSQAVLAFGLRFF